jgi:hypothetical protein
MRNQLFSGKVKYTRQAENGKLKKISEQVLLEAVSFTDAEVMLYEYYESVMKQTMLSITNIDKVAFDEVILSEEILDERIFVIIKVKIEYQDLDNDKTKTQIYKCLLESKSFEDAKKMDSQSIADRFSSTKSEIVSITKTAYEDYIPQSQSSVINIEETEEKEIN